ncbi:MAG: 2-oxoacid:acceptor oxidoreductase subunit alpha [Chloroflexi bacterium]|nr:2-oxoacid:acceptor oxidoreductase subunit alpha [Chloroflexota bacterium]
MNRRDFVVRFAGEGGQGVVTAAEALARIAAEVGYHVQTFSTFPSQVLGGPTWTQTRISTAPVLSSGDELDVLVALNNEAYEEHRDQLGDTGVVLYDSSFQPEGLRRGIGIPFDQLAKQAGDIRTANMVMMGALAHLVNMPRQFLQDFVVRRFQARGDALVQTNFQAMALGREAASKGQFTIGDLALPSKPQYRQVFVKGNEAWALGSMASGIDFYIGYPISPATPILVFMERNLLGPGKFAYQASSELEAINAAIGAGYAGARAMTGTSGPGLSLMSEGLGLAWMAEIPVVVLNVQRGGPATGLPTKTEQADLFLALSPAHGDAMLPVIAPGTVEECFYAAISAFNWAERYQGPVIVLSEMQLAERAENITKPQIENLVSEGRKVYQGGNGYQRYDGFELSPMPIPGKPGAYVANGSEHDAIGDTTHLPSRHIQMTERRFSKLRLLNDGGYDSESAREPIAVMSWGGSKGPAFEAYHRLKEKGERLAWYYTMYLHPLPSKLLEELRQKELVIVPELNYQGQFSSYLRTLGVRAESITQYTGLPFKPKELVVRVADRVRTHRKKAVPV